MVESDNAAPPYRCLRLALSLWSNCRLCPGRRPPFLVVKRHASHTKAPLKNDSLWRTLRGCSRPGRAWTGPKELPHDFVLYGLGRIVHVT
jgi:hypothetical protein